MKFNILTFIFEIINFFVLLWLLKRLLYKPVISLLMERKKLIESKISEAEEAERRYRELNSKYEDLLKRLDEEKKSRIAQLNREVEKRRRELEERLNEEIRLEKERFLSSLESERQRFLSEMKDEVVKLSVQFSSKLLKRIADEHVHRKLFELAVDALKSIPKGEVSNIKDELKSRGLIKVESAYPLSGDDVDMLKETVEKLFGVKVNVSVTTDSSIVAGVKLHVGSKLIDSSIEGQLSSLEEVVRRELEAV